MTQLTLDRPNQAHPASSGSAIRPIADTPRCCIAPEQPFFHLAKSFLEALLACKRHEASRLVMEAVKSGTSVKDIYTYVFQQSQREVGRLWQINDITIAQEHYCTAATQMIMSQLYPQILSAARIGRCFVGAGVGGDLHELGIRMVSDFFEIDGWDTIYLGANVPAADLIRTLLDRKPDVVGISATIAPHIPAVAETIAAIRATPGCGKIKIIVGGRPFNASPNLWKQVNADAVCADARETVDIANGLIAGNA